jgi:aryl-alcohol dehydrogenase-like predicted oxidoreductase
LTGGWESRRSVRMIRVALDSGFRHFDVAPPYGIGTAEDVLGLALSGHRAQVTVASKVGRPRPILSTQTQLLRLLATPIRRLAAGKLRKRERSVPPASTPPDVQLTLPIVKQSLAESLRRLRTDYLDLLLLHEAKLTDLTDELLCHLDKVRQAGVARAIGIASAHENVRDIANVHGNFFDALQYSWSPLDSRGLLACPVDFHITHRALMRAFEPLREWLDADASVARRLSSAIDVDLTESRVLSNVLLGAAMAQNPGGIVLVGTRREDRVVQNAEAMRDPVWVERGTAFLVAMSREPSLPRTN